MSWIVELTDSFWQEFKVLEEDVQTEILAQSRVLQVFGPHMGRPRVDTLNGSRHANMKELRFRALNKEWRLAFAFDPARTAILLAVGDKKAENTMRFYRRLIRKADERFDLHLKRLEKEARYR